MTDDPQSPNVRAWSDGAFLDEVTRWVADAATGCGITLTGEREQPHLRPWSSTVRVGTESGDLWFKVNGSGTRHEAALLGARTGRAGPGARRAGRRTPARLDAHARRRLADQPEAVLETGVALLTPEVLPGRLRALVEELSALPVEEGGLTARYADYDAWCDELATSGVPSSLQHDDRRVLRVRDSYLEHFTVYAGRADLLRCTAHARRTGCVTRALSWRMALEGEPVATHRHYDFPVRAWLLELLDA